MAKRSTTNKYIPQQPINEIDWNSLNTQIEKNSKVRKAENEAKSAQWEAERKAREAAKKTAEAQRKAAEEARKQAEAARKIQRETEAFNRQQAQKAQSRAEGRAAQERARQKRESQKRENQKQEVVSKPQAIPVLKSNADIEKINSAISQMKKTPFNSPEQIAQRNAYRKYSSQSIGNTRPMSDNDKAITAQLKAVTDANRAKENAQKRYGVAESALMGAGEAITAPFSGASIILDKIAGKDVFNDDDVIKRTKFATNQAKTAHDKAYGAGYLGGMALGSYALGGGSAGASQATSAKEAYQTAKEAAKTMYGLSEQQAIIPALKATAKALGVNTLKELPKDLLLDTLPRTAEVLDDENMSTGEKIGAIASNIGINAAMNNVSELPALVGIGKDVAKNISDIRSSGIFNKLTGKATDSTKGLLSVLQNNRALKQFGADQGESALNSFRQELDALRANNQGERQIIDALETPEAKAIREAAQKQADEAQKVVDANKPIEEYTENALKQNNDVMDDIGKARSELDKYFANADYTKMTDEQMANVPREINDIVSKYANSPQYEDILNNAVDDMNSFLRYAGEARPLLENKAYAQAQKEMSEVFNNLDIKNLTDDDFAELPRIYNRIAEKYYDSPDYEEIKRLAVSYLNDVQKKYTSSAPSVIKSDLYNDNVLNHALGSIDGIKTKMQEAIERNADKMAEWQKSGTSTYTTALNNIERFNKATEALETAIKNGADVDEIVSLEREVKLSLDAYRKNVKDAEIGKLTRSAFNPNNEESVNHIVTKGRKRAELPVDENGNIIVSDEDMADMPFNDFMNEDTEIRQRFNIDESPDIRLDASDANNINPDDSIIPEVNVERLTKEPNKIVNELKERSFHASAKERGAIPEEIKAALREQDSLERNMYTEKHNWQTEDEAINLWDQVNTYDEAEETYRKLLETMNPAATPFARRLVSAYSKDGRTEAAMAVMDALSEAGTKSGRFSQSMILGLTKDNPVIALRYIERSLDKINREGLEKFGKKKWKNFTLTKSEREMFEKIAPGDEQAIKKASDLIGKRLEKEYPVKLMEQLKEATHVGMLLNMRTMSRNVMANIPTLGMRAAANRVEGVAQRIAHLTNKDIEVTQSILGGGPKSRKLAKEIYNSPRVQELLEALDPKYDESANMSKYIRNRQMFKGGGILNNALDGILGGFWKENGGLISAANKKLGAEGNNNILETARRVTYKLLEMGDTPFVKENFVARLASEAKVKGWKSADDVTEEAIQRAFKESLEATYKDANALSKLLLDLKRDTGLVGEAAIPFAQTLGSIGMRSKDYSPVGFGEGIVRIIKGAKNEDAKAVEEGIRRLAQGLTGSGMILGGISLYKAGLITGDYSDDPQIKELQKRAGYKPYAIHLGDKYYTFDWMQPASIPAILGISIAQAVEKTEESTDKVAQTISGTINGAEAAINAWFNQSAFQSLAELLGGGNDTSYGENSIARNFAEMVLEMPQRLIGTAIGATARTSDRAYHDTYDPTSYINNYANQVKAKIPELSKTLPQSYDAWGQPRMRTNSTEEAIFQQFINPGEYSEEQYSELDSRLNEIYREYPDKNLFPGKIPYSLSVGDFKKKLNNKEHSELAKTQGEYNSTLIKGALDSDAFKGMSNEQKADTTKALYSLARDLAYEKLYQKEPTEDNQKLAQLYKEHGAEAVVDYMDVKKNLPDTKDLTKIDALAKLPEDKQDVLLPALFNVEGSDKKKEMWEKSGKDGSEYIKLFQKEQEKEAKATALKEKEAKAKQKERVMEAAKANMQSSNLEDVQSELASYGANNSPETVDYYIHAKQVIPSLTPKQYTNHLKNIGGSDYKISQKEMITYANNNNLSEETMNKYWNAFGEWKSIPVLSNGTWKSKRR